MVFLCDQVAVCIPGPGHNTLLQTQHSMAQRTSAAPADPLSASASEAVAKVLPMRRILTGPHFVACQHTRRIQYTICDASCLRV